MSRNPRNSTAASVLIILASAAASALGIWIWFLLLTSTCRAAHCTPVTCISSAGCIAPCVCAKQQGDAFGYCSGTSITPEETRHE